MRSLHLRRRPVEDGRSTLTSPGTPGEVGLSGPGEGLACANGFHVLPVSNVICPRSPDRLAQNQIREFGKDLVFGGGGVDTQKTLPFGTPEEVYSEVRERIEIFGEGGGFVFNTIHNVQGNAPPDNVQAMFRAVRGSYA